LETETIGKLAAVAHRTQTGMRDRDIRAMLRGATAARLLRGWQGPHLSERSYCLTPAYADPMERPLDDVIGYCRLLSVAGIEPLYRDSEPG
jgi:hypothetical protein